MGSLDSVAVSILMVLNMYYFYLNLSKEELVKIINLVSPSLSYLFMVVIKKSVMIK